MTRRKEFLNSNLSLVISLCVKTVDSLPLWKLPSEDQGDLHLPNKGPCRNRHSQEEAPKEGVSNFQSNKEKPKIKFKQEMSSLYT